MEVAHRRANMMTIISKIQTIKAKIHNIKKEIKNNLSWENIKKVVKEKISIFFENHPFIHKMVIGIEIFVLAYATEIFLNIGDSVHGTEGILSVAYKCATYYGALFCIFQIGSIVFKSTKKAKEFNTGKYTSDND